MSRQLHNRLERLERAKGIGEGKPIDFIVAYYAPDKTLVERCLYRAGVLVQSEQPPALASTATTSVLQGH